MENDMSSLNTPQSLNPSEIQHEESFRPRSFSDAIKRIKRDSIKDSVRSLSYNPTSQKHLHELGNFLLNNDTKDVEGKHSEKIRQVLEDLTPVFTERYQVLLRKIDTWKKLRIPLIYKLKNYIEKLDRNFKWSTIVRLLASTADVTGSVGGLMMNSDSSWGKFAFGAASVCGLCGVFSTVLEVASSKKILDDVSDLREEDYKLFEEVVQWFEENEDLDLAVEDLFPHGIDKNVVFQIQEASKELDEYLKVFESALVSNIRKDAELLGSKDFLYGLQLFSRSNVASLWWNRIIFRKHPIHLDLNRMTLQMEFGQMQSFVLQSIPSLPLEQQRLTSLPVAGRVMLNFLTMYDSFSYIQKGAKSMHSDKLRKLVEGMEREMAIIDDAVQRMRRVDHQGVGPIAETESAD